MTRFTLLSILLALLCGGSGLVGQTGSAAAAASAGANPASPTARSAGGGQATENYVIGPLDGLQFRIIGEPETQIEVRVAGDGTVNLPYVGSINLAGKSIGAARQQLFEIYDRDWYVNPQIDLLVVSYAQRRVQVLGKVMQQGFVIFPPEEEMTLLGAISGAGGWSYDNLANKSNVVLKRIEADGTQREYPIDATKIGPGDWPLRNGDIIEVPERRW